VNKKRNHLLQQLLLDIITRKHELKQLLSVLCFAWLSLLPYQLPEENVKIGNKFLKNFFMFVPTQLLS
jgi:hypothetical protein